MGMSPPSSRFKDFWTYRPREYVTHFGFYRVALILHGLSEITAQAFSRIGDSLPALDQRLVIPMPVVNSDAAIGAVYGLGGVLYGDGIHFVARVIRERDGQVFESDGLVERGAFRPLGFTWNDLPVRERVYLGPGGTGPFKATGIANMQANVAICQVEGINH